MLEALDDDVGDTNGRDSPPLRNTASAPGTRESGGWLIVIGTDWLNRQHRTKKTAKTRYVDLQIRETCRMRAQSRKEGICWYSVKKVEFWPLQSRHETRRFSDLCRPRHTYVFVGSHKMHPRSHGKTITWSLKRGEQAMPSIKAACPLA